MSRSILSAKGWALPSGPSGEESILQEWASFSWLSMDSAQVENWEYCKWFLPVDVSDSCSVEKITPNMTLFLLVALSVRCFAQAFSSGGECRLLSGCGASHCSGFSCCRTQALGAWASVVVAHRLTHCLACGVFLDQGSKLCPLHWQAYSYPLGPQGSPTWHYCPIGYERILHLLASILPCRIYLYLCSSDSLLDWFQHLTCSLTN